MSSTTKKLIFNLFAVILIVLWMLPGIYGDYLRHVSTKTKESELTEPIVVKLPMGLRGVPYFYKQKSDVNTLIQEYYAQWNVGIIEETTLGQKFICGGVLIQPGMVLTSASCFDTPMNRENLRAVFADGGISTHNVKLISVHEDYNAGSYYSDIALVRFDLPPLPSEDLTITGGMEYEKQIGLLHLASLPSYNKTRDYEYSGMVTDWDAFPTSKTPYTYDWPKEDPIQPWLFATGHQYVISTRNVTVISNELCEELYQRSFARRGMDFKEYFPRGIDNSLVCVTSNNPPQCELNRGHVLVKTEEELNKVYQETEYDFVVLGVRARGQGTIKASTQCREHSNNLPGIYTNVDTYSYWIAYECDYINCTPESKEVFKYNYEHNTNKGIKMKGKRDA